MTKQEFVGQVAAKSGLTQKDATKAVDAFLDSISDALKEGDSVTFAGFGKFSTNSTNRSAELGLRAKQLRESAQERKRDNRDFALRIEDATATLKEIAGLA